MDGFKKNPKIACYKEGGQVGYKSRKDHSESKEMSKDVKQDKSIVKKAVGQHEAAKHKGEGKTELKLKTGGRCKKDGGTVRKYKKGGEVIGMKKTAEDKKDIAGIKKKGSAPKKAAPKTKKMPTQEMGMAAAEFPMEGEMPAFQMGGNVPVGQGAMSDMDRSIPVGQGAMSETDRKMMELERKRKMARTQNAMGAGLTPSQMGEFAGQEMAAPQAPAPMGGMGQPGGMGGGQDAQSIMEGLKQLGKYAQGGCV